MDSAGDQIDVNGAVNVDVTATDVIATTNGINVGTGVNGAVTGTVVVNASGKAASTTTATHSMDAITVTGGTTVNVTQKATSDIGTFATTGTQAAATITQGDVTIVGGDTTTSVTVKQDATVGPVQAKAAVAAVPSTSVVTFGLMAAAGDSVTVNGLKFTAAKALTAEQVASAFAGLNSATVADLQASGGIVANGVFTGSNTTPWTSGAATGASVTFSAVAGTATPLLANTGTAVLPTATTATAGTAAGAAKTGILGVTAGKVLIDDNTTASITTVSVDGYGAGSKIGNGTALDKLTTVSLANSANDMAIDTAATTLGLTLNKITGTVDIDNSSASIKTLNITTATADSATALTATLVETLNVTGTNLVSLTSDLAQLKTVTVSGSAGLTLNAATADTITSINTSATTGTVTTTIDGTKATYTGGAGVDNVTTTTTTAPTKAINLGAGNDTITLASGTTAMGTNGTIDGGAGTDTLSMLAANAVTASGDTTFAGKVTNFEQLTLTGATGLQTIDAAKLGNYNYVTVVTAAAATTTLTGLTSGATIALNDANDTTNASDTIVATIKDATLVPNTSDVLNIAISAKAAGIGAAAGTADDNGTVTAAGVETINISVLDAVNEATAVGAPVGTKNIAADTQKLTLQATSAKTITITGDTALNLTNVGNTAVTLIDGSTMTGALTVQAAGTVATTIKGGSGNDVLTASTVGASAVITNDAVAGVAAVAAAFEVDTFTAAASYAAGETVIIDGVTYTSISVTTAANMATAIRAGATDANVTVTGTPSGKYAVTGAGANVIYTANAAGPLATLEDTGTNAAVLADTTDGVTAVIAVPEQVTVVLTDTDLSTGGTMALTVGGTAYTYTAAADVTMDAAAAGLAALIDAGTHAAAYVAGTNTLTITAATTTATDLLVGSYTVTGATSSSTVVGDTLIGGAGNDTLYAGNLAQLTGGAGNDKFVMNVPTNVNSYSTITDLSAGDVIQLTAGESFASAGVTLAGTAVFQDYANAAVNKLALDNVDNGWFQFGGNTYVVANDSQADATNANFENGIDGIIKITGLVDLSTASYNQTTGTLEIA